VRLWSRSTEDVRVIEEVLRADPGSLGVLTTVHDVIYLIDRPRFETALSGRLGFGRALLYRRTPTEAGAAPPDNERSGTWAEDEQTAQTLAKIGNDVTQVQNQT